MLYRSTIDKSQKRFCIFCGKEPESKNKEHIVPAWLIKQTGDPSREVSFGISVDLDTGNMTHRTFAFNKFVFPACQNCNSEFGHLEARAQGYINKLMLGQELEGFHMSELLDWFDKIRIGLWLAMKVHHTNPVAETPNFYIQQRMGIYDRALIIEKLTTDQKGVTFTGINTCAFHYMPSAFSLRINEFIFTNISTHHLLARRLGFPYKSESNIDPTTSFEVTNLSEGTERVNTPIFLNEFLNKGLLIAQPVYRAALKVPNSRHLYDSQFVKDHSMEEGLGNIYVQRNHTVQEYGFKDNISFSDIEHLPEHYFGTNNTDRIFKCQLWLVKNFTPSDKLLNSDQKLHLKRKLKYVIRLTKLVWRLGKE
jgi:hypothetical protein